MREERAAAAKEANAARKRAQAEKNEQKTKMKGKNKPSGRHRKKQSNITEEQKVGVVVWLSTADERSSTTVPLRVWLLCRAKYDNE